MPATAEAIAQWYGKLLGGLLIDSVDCELAASITTATRVLPTLMSDLDSKVQLAREALDFARHLD